MNLDLSNITIHPPLPKERRFNPHPNPATVDNLLDAILTDGDIEAGNGDGLPDVKTWNRIVKLAVMIEREGKK